MGPQTTFDVLNPDKRPQIKFNLTKNELDGDKRCNGFSSTITIDVIKFSIAIYDKGYHTGSKFNYAN
jgi:hypothetical protein